MYVSVLLNLGDEWREEKGKGPARSFVFYLRSTFALSLLNFALCSFFLPSLSLYTGSNTKAVLPSFLDFRFPYLFLVFNRVRWRTQQPQNALFVVSVSTI